MAFRGGNVNNTEGATGSVTKPAGTIDGDIVLLWTVCDGTGDVVTWPSGFVEDSLSPLNTSVLDAGQLRWAWKVASGEGASWSITDSGTACKRGCAVWSGRDTVTFIHRISALTDTTSRASPWTATSSAFASNTSLVGCDIGFIQEDDENGTTVVVHTAPSGFTVGAEMAGATFTQSALSYKDAAPAGETGVYAGVGTAAGRNTNLAIVAFALAPAAAPVIPPRIARMMAPQQRMCA